MAVEEAVRGVPCAALRPHVAWYSGYRRQGVPPGTHRGLPSPYLTLIFTLDDPLTLLAHPDPAQSPGSFTTLLGGLHTSPALITHDGRQSGVQLALSPLGAQALLGLPSGELSGIDLDADAVLGRLAPEIQERLRAAPDWDARFAVLDALLAARLLRPSGRHRARWMETAPEVARAWTLLLASGGAVSAAALAAEVGWSGRRLAERFRREIGLSPKAAARVIRFDRARRRLQPGPQGGAPLIADVAAECGYYDQAHLAREFRALAGCPPSRWLAEEAPNADANADASSETSKPSGAPRGETGRRAIPT